MNDGQNQNKIGANFLNNYFDPLESDFKLSETCLKSFDTVILMLGQSWIIMCSVMKMTRKGAVCVVQ